MYSRSGLFVADKGSHVSGLADSPGRADVTRTVNKEVVDNHLEHGHVVVCQVLFTPGPELLIQGGAVVDLQVFLRKT